MMKSKSKFRNKKNVVRGITFDSKLESYVYLKILELDKRYNFRYRLQPRYILVDKFAVDDTRFRAITYIADFELEINGRTYTIDVKGFKTNVFSLKEKLFAKQYNRLIICVKSVREFEDWFKRIIKIKEEKN